MNILNKRRVEEIIEHGFHFDIGKYISQGFELVKKDLGLFIGYTLIVALILGAASSIASFMQFLAPGSISIQMISSLSSNIITQVVSPPLMAGFLLACFKINNNERIEFGDFFKGFDYFGQLMIQGLIFLGLTLLIYAPLLLIFYFVGFFDFDFISGPPEFGTIQLLILILGVLVTTVIYIYISVSYLYSYCFLIFGDMQAWEAMETSRQVVSKNFWPIFGFAIVLGLLFVLGYILCCVGLLFTIPTVQAAIFLSFKDIVQLNDPDAPEQNDIMDHLVS